MVHKRLNNPLFLFYLLAVYIIVQFSWWLYLIFSLYQQVYADREMLLHKIWMLVGEGSVFLVILLGGIYSIRRALKREKQVRQLQENFLQSVSHELKTPIASIGLSLETLQKRKLDDRQSSVIYNRSLQEVYRLNRLVSDILTARNIEHNNYFFDRQPIAIHQFVQETVDRLRASVLQHHHIVLQLHPATVSFDPDALNSLTHNLLENACKYAPHGSAITVQTAVRASKTLLSVADEGTGIPDHQKKRVFDKFYRIESEATRKSKGTGLGLYIARFLVERQGGNIQLSDSQPKGLTVTVTF